MNLQHEYLVLALHEAKARDYEREAEMTRLAREARAARAARRTRPEPNCRPAVAR